MARDLRKAGWPDARALVGGWAMWQEAGMPIEKRPADDLHTLTMAR